MLTWFLKRFVNFMHHCRVSLNTRLYCCMWGSKWWNIWVSRNVRKWIVWVWILLAHKLYKYFGDFLIAFTLLLHYFCTYLAWWALCLSLFKLERIVRKVRHTLPKISIWEMEPKVSQWLVNCIQFQAMIRDHLYYSLLIIIFKLNYLKQNFATWALLEK